MGSLASANLDSDSREAKTCRSISDQYGTCNYPLNSCTRILDDSLECSCSMEIGGGVLSVWTCMHWHARISLIIVKLIVVLTVAMVMINTMFLLHCYHVPRYTRRHVQVLQSVNLFPVGAATKKKKVNERINNDNRWRRPRWCMFSGYSFG